MFWSNGQAVSLLEEFSPDPHKTRAWKVSKKKGKQLQYQSEPT